MKPIDFHLHRPETRAEAQALLHEQDGDRIVYLMRFADEETRRRRWAAFQGDQDWKALKTASEANGPIIAEMLSRTLASPAYWPHDTARQTP